MEFRKSTHADADGIMEIIRQAQSYLKSQGIDQWQNNYPNPEVVKKDIDEENGYVIVKDKLIIGTVTVSFDGESTYDVIYDGAWKSNQPFAVIHRIAVRDEYKGQGISSKIIRWIEEMCLKKGIHSIKVDTHEKNLSMQKILKNNGFEYCGIIYLANGSKRMAFEKMI
ncbi:MAG: GNAT family N-acetyltransferase [Clostridiales bacterium]|jgi:GNAT superfamily N-acetyltransferase|nr:GNAT family N-acetyltransferase [Clostridiales bacterium]